MRASTPSVRNAAYIAVLSTVLVSAAAVAADIASAEDGSPAAALKLHVPSPDWRDQVIYFLMTDRFDDGDPSSNDQRADEYDPADNAKFSGGDFKGIERRLAYIKGLGATAIWITPPVANQWWNTRSRYGGYHGYWAEDFMRVDAHYGSLQDYRRLSHAIHGAGMYLVQDVVVNHVADYFSYAQGWDGADPARHFRRVPDSRGRLAPTQAPFDRNDASDPVQRDAAIYHWTPTIKDFNDPRQEHGFQLADLDDLNTENPAVRDALRASYGYWIDTVGVDAFRVDTAFYVPPDYFRDFLYSDDAQHPGILRVAARTGRKAFHVFGEGFGMDKPYADLMAHKIDSYMRAADGTPLLPGMINFPLYGTAVDVFARGHPTAELAHRIEDMMRVHARPHLMPTFIDNHDVDRFLAGGSEAGLQQALLLIMTLPGIPVIYYGTEQGFTEQRAAMFAGGYGSGGRNRFDTSAPLYRFIKRATALRREHKVFSRGTPTLLARNAASPGVLAYRMDDGDESALVMFNTSDGDALLDNLETGLPPGTLLTGLFGMTSPPQAVVVGADGSIHMRLPARSGLVWKVTNKIQPSPVLQTTPARATLTLDPLSQATASGDFQVSGTARGVPMLQVVVDGDLANSQAIRPGSDGRWQATVGTGDMVDPTIRHSVVAWMPSPAAAASADAAMAVSERRDFNVSQPWTVLVEVSDPADDDVGRDGRYRYPTDPGWSDHHQLDIRNVRISGAGGAMRVELQMREVTASWNPPNGFDHVAFTIFVQVRGRDGGSRVMPMQNALLPDGMRWHYRLRAHGWTNASFSAAGASATSEGTVVTPTATIQTDAKSRTVGFTFPAAALGRLASLSGIKVYVVTWDYDGGYRGLEPDAQPHIFGGGNGAVDPLIMDDTIVIEVP